jgi:hypothetical protein
MNTRKIERTPVMLNEFQQIAEFYKSKGEQVSIIRPLGEGKFRIELGWHGFYATFKRDNEGRIIGDVQTVA